LVPKRAFSTSQMDFSSLLPSPDCMNYSSKEEPIRQEYL
jgi:hypothetical protein